MYGIDSGKFVLHSGISCYFPHLLNELKHFHPIYPDFNFWEIVGYCTYMQDNTVPELKIVVELGNLVLRVNLALQKVFVALIYSQS